MSPSPLFADRERTLSLLAELRAFDQFGAATQVGDRAVAGSRVPTFTNEFWTAGQRQANRLHEVSYRACFKPQLPRFFVERLTGPGDLVYDPFMGRGTTLVEAALLGRRVAGCDVSPLAEVLCRPRLEPPTADEVAMRLASLPWQATPSLDEHRDLLAFYHPDTLSQLLVLRDHLLGQEHLDAVDAWVRMVAVNRLTGHSPGFFSVYTLPPNQATSVAAQRRINDKRAQTPPRRDVPELILRKTRSLLKDVDAAIRATLADCAPRILCGPASQTSELEADSVALVVTSPPFLDVVHYTNDNWLRCWFCGIDAAAVPVTMARSVEAWQAAMAPVFVELHRVLRRGGCIAFEVGEVRGGQVRLEDAVLPIAVEARLEPICVQINAQDFTKTANCWGVDNNRRGTNTNRVVVLRKG